MQFWLRTHDDMLTLNLMCTGRNLGCQHWSKSVHVWNLQQRGRRGGDHLYKIIKNGHKCLAIANWWSYSDGAGPRLLELLVQWSNRLLSECRSQTLHHAPTPGDHHHHDHVVEDKTASGCVPTSGGVASVEVGSSTNWCQWLPQVIAQWTEAPGVLLAEKPRWWISFGVANGDCVKTEANIICCYRQGCSHIISVNFCGL